MKNLITWEALNLLVDCATDLYKRLHKALYNTEPTEDCARNVARDFCIDFLHEKGIYGVEDEDEIPDDIREKAINDYLAECIKNNYHCQHCAKNHNNICLFASQCFMIDMMHFDDEEEEIYIPDDVDESNYNPYAGCDEYETDYFEEW